MLQDEKQLKTSVATDLEGLAGQCAELHDDMAALSQSVASLARHRERRLAADLSEDTGEAEHDSNARSGVPRRNWNGRSTATLCRPWVLPQARYL
jgi:hypothetical protein